MGDITPVINATMMRVKWYVSKLKKFILRCRSIYCSSLDFFELNITMEMVKNMDPKNMDQKKLRYIFRRVLRRIKEKPEGFFKFRKMRLARGLWHSGDLIEIDHRNEIVPTIIHEVLHDLYETKCEKWIYRVESKISQILRPVDVYKLMISFFSKMEIQKRKK